MARRYRAAAVVPADGLRTLPRPHALYIGIRRAYIAATGPIWAGHFNRCHLLNSEFIAHFQRNGRCYRHLRNGRLLAAAGFHAHLIWVGMLLAASAGIFQLAHPHVSLPEGHRGSNQLSPALLPRRSTNSNKRHTTSVQRPARRRAAGRSTDRQSIVAAATYRNRIIFLKYRCWNQQSRTDVVVVHQ